MSWTFQLQKINQSFDKIASWYEFMHRTELCFEAFHKRLIILEAHHDWQGPSDEQVERVLRKILAEKFSREGVEPIENPYVTDNDGYFVEDRRNLAVLRPVPIDAASLFVEPESVPSKAYVENFRLLDRQLVDFPRLDPGRHTTETAESKPHVEGRNRRGVHSV